MSIGETCDIIFNEIHSSNEIVQTVKSGSMYTMSQPSQWFWQHRIDKASSDSSSRYSLTFRSVDSRFRKSCIVMGDSNTAHLKFGTGNGSFGYNMPGKRIESTFIDNLDPVKCVGHSNIFIMCGINDIKGKSKPSEVSKCFDKFVGKLEEMQYICSNARIVVAPLLPTKDHELNKRVLHFNQLLFDYVNNINKHIITLDFNEFCDHDGLLSESMGRYQAPSDMLHLGSSGIRRLVALIRQCVNTRRIGTRLYSSFVGGADNRVVGWKTGDVRSYGSVVSGRGNAES